MNVVFYIYCVTVHSNKKNLLGLVVTEQRQVEASLIHFLQLILCMKYKRDIHLIFKIPWRPLSESVAPFLPVIKTIILASLSFYKDLNKECLLTNFEQFTSFYRNLHSAFISIFLHMEIVSKQVDK